MNLTDIYRAFHPMATEYTFSSVHGTFSSIEHMLWHKNLNKFKVSEIISNIVFDYSGMKLEISNSKKSGNLQIHGK